MTSPAFTAWAARLSCPDGADREAVGKGVRRVDDVVGDAGDPGLAGDLGHDRCPVAGPRLLEQPSREDRPKDALVAEVLADRQVALRVKDGHPGARAGAARGAVDRPGPGR